MLACSWKIDVYMDSCMYSMNEHPLSMKSRTFRLMGEMRGSA
jgi:hypothetical protein